MSIEDSGDIDLKLQLRKFLHSNGLNDYRVLKHEDIFEIVQIKHEDEKPERQEGLKPSMPGPVAGIPHNVRPSDMVEWSSHPWEKKTRKKD